MFAEGFTSAIRAVSVASLTAGGEDPGQAPTPDEIARNRARNSALVLKFRGIPDGVTVMASPGGTGTALKDDMTDLAPLYLVTGEDEGADEDGMVTLSSVGAGEVMYRFDDVDNVFLVPPLESGTPAERAGVLQNRRRHERME